MSNTQIAVANPLALLALQIAVGQLGQRETKYNSGPMVDKYLKAVGLPPGYAWCQAFVYWCYNEAAAQLKMPNPVFKTAGVMACWNGTAHGAKLTRIEVRDNPELILPGSQFIMNYGGGKGHTGLIESVEGAVLHTIEGNSNNSGSREGIEVVRNRRLITNALIQGFIHY